MEVTKTKNPEIWLKFLENRKCAKTTGFSLPSFVLFLGGCQSYFVPVLSVFIHVYPVFHYFVKLPGCACNSNITLCKTKTLQDKRGKKEKTKT